MSHAIIDRRKNAHGKSLPNREKFIERNKEQIKRKIRDSFSKRSITSDEGEDITINSDGIDEPNFNYDRKTGDWEWVLPGNKEYVPGDEIDKEKKGVGKGKGDEPSDKAGGEDSFTFSISKDEYLDILFEGLELPNLVKRSENAAVTHVRKRAGYSKEGSSSALDLSRTLKNSYGRRVALAFPLDKKIRELEELLDISTDKVEIEELKAEIEILKIRRTAVSYIDPVDVRYKRFDKQPVPNTRAVMFCIMDVSGSMDEEKKEISKRFFLLLYLFLQKKYKKVDVVFIRHTTVAEEVDEDTFFYDQLSGGTIVSSSYELTSKIIADRYDSSSWNVYACQASDGDNFYSDNAYALKGLKDILAYMQYYIYIEVKGAGEYIGGMYGVAKRDVTTLSGLFGGISDEFNQFLSIALDSIADVVPEFRKAFLKNDAK